MKACTVTSSNGQCSNSYEVFMIGWIVQFLEGFQNDRKTFRFFLLILASYSNTFGYFSVIGSGPEGRLCEAPPPELRERRRMSCECFDASLGIIPGL
jgi:hypothetical protein